MSLKRCREAKPCPLNISPRKISNLLKNGSLLFHTNLHRENHLKEEFPIETKNVKELPLEPVIKLPQSMPILETRTRGLLAEQDEKTNDPEQLAVGLWRPQVTETGDVNAW